jgi:phosphatidylglycerophosphatase A
MKIPDILIIIISIIFLAFILWLLKDMIKDWIICRWFKNTDCNKEDYPIFYDEDNNNKNE